MIKVSVIVPVYNVEKYLKKCLDSVVNQTLKDIEIVIVNDGSPDNSELIIDEYTNKYKNILSLKKQNGGLSSARNYGLKHAHGQYVVFLDSDDYIDLNMLKDMYVEVTKRKLDILVCDHYKVYETNDNKTLIKSNLKYSNDDIKNYIISSPAASLKMFKRNLFDDDFLFTEGIYYEDLSLMPTFIVKTKKIGFIDKPYYYYLQRNSSIMHQKEFNKKQLDIFRVLNNIKNIYIKNNIYEDYKKEIEYLYITHLLRTATLRFLKFGNVEEYLKMINDTMKKEFPNWSKNVYFKKSSYKLKLICYLAYNKNYRLLKMIDRKKNI